MLSIILLTIPFCQSLDNGGGSTSSHGGRTSTPNSALDAENMEDKTIDNIKEENGGNGRDALSPSSHGNHFGTSVSPLSSLINQNASSPVNSPLLSLHSSSSGNHLSSLAQHHNLNNNKSSNSLLSPTNDGRNIEGKRNHMIIDKYCSYVGNTHFIRGINWYFQYLSGDHENVTTDVSGGGGNRNSTQSSSHSHHDSHSTTPPKHSAHWPPTHHLNMLSSLDSPLKTSMAPYSASGVNSGGLSPPPSVLSTHSSAYSQLPISTSAYSSSSSPSHTSNVSQHLPTPQAPTHHASYRDHSDSYRNHHHSTISSQVRHTIRNITLLLIHV